VSTGGLEPFALERWFASASRAGMRDLASSGAPPRSLAEILALASPSERASFARASLGYGPPDGSPALRAAIAGRAGVPAAEVLVTCGAIEALHLTVYSLVRPGDEVVVQHPMYPAVEGLARLWGARVVPWRLEPGREFRGSVRVARALLGPRTRLVAITQPNGPTGSVLEPSELDELVDALSRRGIWLLSDEVYRELDLEGGFLVASAAGRYERAICVGDVAKPFGLGGLRIGWLATAAAGLRERARALRDYTTLSVPTPSDALARIALAHADALLHDALALARENLARLASLAARDHALSFAVPRAGLTAFVRVANAPRVQRALEDDDVLVVPGALFGHPDRLRIGLGARPDDFAYAMERLGRLL
jgi:aspartate/methionine/tyrosine aminotransferase